MALCGFQDFKVPRTWQFRRFSTPPAVAIVTYMGLSFFILEPQSRGNDLAVYLSIHCRQFFVDVCGVRVSFFRVHILSMMQSSAE